MPTINVHGDSTAYGYYDSEAEMGGFAGRLHHHFMDRAAHRTHPTTEVLNYSASNQTLEQITSRLPHDLDNTRPGNTLEIVKVGLIDALIPRGDTEPKVPVVRFESALEQLGDICVRRNISVMFLINTPERLEALQPFARNGNYLPDNGTDPYMGVVRSFVESQSHGNFSYVDFNNPYLLEANHGEGELLDDGKDTGNSSGARIIKTPSIISEADDFHLNSAGHELIYSVIKPKVYEILSIDPVSVDDEPLQGQTKSNAQPYI